MISTRDVRRSIGECERSRFQIAPGRNFEDIAKRIYQDYRRRLANDEGGAYVNALEQALNRGYIIERKR